MENTSSNPKNGKRILILGSEGFVHAALSKIFSQELGVECALLEKLESDANNGNTLLLIDAMEDDFEEALANLQVTDHRPESPMPVGLFNLLPNMGVERRAFMRGVRGFFYSDNRLEHILKGLQALMRGEFWISRNLLVEVALEAKENIQTDTLRRTALTHREMQVLALVSVGATNDEIAEKLYISPHTVKTHLYNVFKKIEVPNRLQAALWAAKHT